MENPNYYAIIPAEVRYAKIKANAKLLYWEITALANKTWECYASNRYFSELYSVSEKQVSVWIKELVDNWFIVSRVEVENGNKRFIAINQKVMTYPPKGVEGSTPKGVHNNTNKNNTNNNINKKEKITDFDIFKSKIDLDFYKELYHEQDMLLQAKSCFDYHIENSWWCKNAKTAFNNWINNSIRYWTIQKKPKELPKDNSHIPNIYDLSHLQCNI